MATERAEPKARAAKNQSVFREHNEESETRTEVVAGALKRGALDKAEQAESERLERDRVAWNLPTPKPAKLIDDASPLEANPS